MSKRLLLSLALATLIVPHAFGMWDESSEETSAREVREREYISSGQKKRDRITRERYEADVMAYEARQVKGLKGLPIRNADGGLTTQEEYEAQGLGRLPDLEIVDFRHSGYQINDKNLAFIAHYYPNLKLVNLSRYVTFTIDGLRALARNCRKLEEINIEYCIFWRRGILLDETGLSKFQEEYPHIRIIIGHKGVYPNQIQLTFKG